MVLNREQNQDIHRQKVVTGERKLNSDEKDRRQKSNNAKGLCNRNSRQKNKEPQK